MLTKLRNTYHQAHEWVHHHTIMVALGAFLFIAMAWTQLIPQLPTYASGPILEDLYEWCDEYVSDIPASECYVLANIYTETNGTNWNNSNGWFTNPEVCNNRYGISCQYTDSGSCIDWMTDSCASQEWVCYEYDEEDECIGRQWECVQGDICMEYEGIDPRVSSIYLDNNNLHGSLTIVGLPYLNDIFISYNNLTNISLSDMPSLGYIEAMYGSIQNIIFSNTPNIYELRINNNQITNINLNSLNYLGYLHIQNNQLTTLDISQHPINYSYINFQDNYIHTLTTANYQNYYQQSWMECINEERDENGGYCYEECLGGEVEICDEERVCYEYNGEDECIDGDWETDRSSCSRECDSPLETICDGDYVCTDREEVIDILEVYAHNNCLTPQDQNTLDFLNTYTPGWESNQENCLEEDERDGDPLTWCDFYADIINVSLAECTALADLYVSTNGDNWTNSNDWFDDTNICNRYGIGCDDLGEYIVSIFLVHNNLVGTIPVSIQNITQLSSLVLMYNTIYGDIPISLANLSNLDTLALGFNLLNTNLDAGLQQLINNIGPAMENPLPSLSLIDIMYQAQGNPTMMTTYLGSWCLENSGYLIGATTLDCLALSDLYYATNGEEWDNAYGWFTNLNMMQRRGISSNGNIVFSSIFGGSVDPEAVGTTVGHIALNNNNIQGIIPDSIQLIFGLGTLSLHNNAITALPDKIANLWSLGILFIGNNILTQLPDTIGNMNLYVLSLGNNPRRLLRSLLNSVMSLGFSEPNISYGNLTIDMLFAGGGMIGEQYLDAVSAIVAFNELTDINIIQNLRDEDYVHLGPVLTSMHSATMFNFFKFIVDIVYTNIPGGSNNYYTIFEYPFFRYFDLEYNHEPYNQNIITTLPDNFSNLNNLYFLDYSYNTIEEVPSSILDLEKLVYLDVSQNELTQMPADINALQTLKLLNINHNNINSIPMTLGSMPNLYALYTIGNPIVDFSNLVNSNLALLHIGHGINEELPIGITDIITLNELWVDETNIVQLPESISNLHNLYRLATTNSQLSTDAQSIPSTLTDLPFLRDLSLAGNQFIGLTPELMSTDNLVRIELRSNPLCNLNQNELDYLDSIPIANWQEDCGGGDTYGCTDPLAINHNPNATIDDGSCQIVNRDGDPFTWCALHEVALDIPLSECDTLVQMYVDTNGENWNNNSGRFDTTTICGNWYGIQCSNGSNISSIYMYENNIVGDVSLNGLPALQMLALENNYVGSIDISNNTQLTHLNLMNNQIIAIDVSNNINLITISLGRNYLSIIDVSNNTNLANLHLQHNQITSIDVSSNIALEQLEMIDNQLTSIDVSNNINLQSLQLDHNELTTIDISNNTNLHLISAAVNQITTLDVSNNINLQNIIVSYNQLQSLDISNNSNLQYLSATDNLLTSLVLPINSSLQGMWVTNNYLTTIPQYIVDWQSLQVIGLSNNCIDLNSVSGPLLSFLEPIGDQGRQDTQSNCEEDSEPTRCNIFADQIDISLAECEALVKIYMDTQGDAWSYNDNWLDSTTICNNRYGVHCLYEDGVYTVNQLGLSRNNLVGDISLNGLDNIMHFDAYENHITNIDTTSNTQLISIDISRNNISNIDLSNNTNLERLYINQNLLTSLDISNNASLWGVYANRNLLETIDLTYNMQLFSIDLSHNQLQTIDVTNNSNLQELYVRNNQIQSIDLSNNDIMTWLDISYNQLSSLDVSQNQNLYGIFARNNMLSSLDTSYNIWLNDLDLRNNQLLQIDLTNNTDLYSLYLDNNKLVSLDISNNTFLQRLFASHNLIDTLIVNDYSDYYQQIETECIGDPIVYYRWGYDRRQDPDTEMWNIACVGYRHDDGTVDLLEPTEIVYKLQHNFNYNCLAPTDNNSINFLNFYDAASRSSTQGCTQNPILLQPESDNQAQAGSAVLIEFGLQNISQYVVKRSVNGVAVMSANVTCTDYCTVLFDEASDIAQGFSYPDIRVYNVVFNLTEPGEYEIRQEFSCDTIDLSGGDITLSAGPQQISCPDPIVYWIVILGSDENDGGDDNGGDNGDDNGASEEPIVTQSGTVFTSPIQTITVPDIPGAEQVTINGVPATQNDNGTRSAEVELAPGQNNLTIIYMTPSGNVEDNLTVEYNPPSNPNNGENPPSGPTVPSSSGPRLLTDTQKGLCEIRDCSDSYYDGACGICDDEHKSAEDPQSLLINNRIDFVREINRVIRSMSCDITQEIVESYVFAYDIGITTIPDICDADMYGPLLREHMAKFLSVFAIKVLGMQPDLSKECAFTDLAASSFETKGYVRLACQLDMMGLRKDGSTDTVFNPRQEVTRAMFGVALSRLIYGPIHNIPQTDPRPWYQTHLNTLKNDNIMTQIHNPDMLEIRGYVMLMLMRVYLMLK